MNQSSRNLIWIGVLLVCCCVIYYRQNALTVLRGCSNAVSLTQSRDIDIESGTPYLIPNDDILNNLSELELWRIYWRYINTIQTICRNQSRFGTLRDGGKEVCLDENYKPSKPCIVYSFGSNFQFDFDETAHTHLGCDVYTYDPTKDPTGKKIPHGIKFFKVGLAGKDYKTKEGWEMKTLQSIFKDNNHEHKTIDIIKFDIEGSEWHFLPNIFETGVYRQIKQILIEVHVGHMFSKANNPYWGNVSLAKQLRSIRLLYERGFRIFMREHVMGNLLNVDAPPQMKITPQNEISLINMAFSQN